ncbi:fibrinogen beta chain-like [Dendronephthya gigantea]|uniref:fibrinogen beta chain-like n=1 Tax=Dendronephthya gigantea TaxID=151771 RepID=UPI00106B0748|nr:fibrinogen beta chain-like [Dendronephthya gigantea]
MNKCLKKECPNGYAFEGEFPHRLDDHGSFSYSANSEYSGITHDATAFVGCHSRKCCACFGPKGGRGHYCANRCEKKNGGIVLRGRIQVWYWIRTRTPERKWKRCMEFKMKTPAGKFVTYHIDRRTGVAQKGTCSKQFDALLNEGTILVNDKESLNNLPPVPGMISFRKDNDKLYVNKEDGWDEIGSEEATKNLTAKIFQRDFRVRKLMKNLNTSLRTLFNKNSQQDSQTKRLKTSINTTFKRFSDKNSRQDALVQSLVANLSLSLRFLNNTNSQQDFKAQRLETRFGEKHSEQDARVQNLERNITLTWKSMEDKLKKIEEKMSVILRASCKDILARNKFTASGVYWIQPAANKQLQVYCDMKTHRGGWTLVYNYGFTNYTDFKSSENAVTPRPNWPENSANTPISTTPPLSESLHSLGAVDWKLWKNIGREIMIKSNINDWIVCKPHGHYGGSMVIRKEGSIRCRNIESVATACRNRAPDNILWRSEGPALCASSLRYYFFDGDTHNSWPTHDPCGRTRLNQKQGVSNPGGQIYIR